MKSAVACPGGLGQGICTHNHAKPHLRGARVRAGGLGEVIAAASVADEIEFTPTIAQN